MDRLTIIGLKSDQYEFLKVFNSKTVKLYGKTRNGKNKNVRAYNELNFGIKEISLLTGLPEDEIRSILNIPFESSDS